MKIENGNARTYKDVQISVPWGFLSGKWFAPYDSRPIVALHGWQDNAGTFDTLIPLLLPEIGILAIDLPGHGLSSYFPPGMMYEYTNNLQAIFLIMKEYKWDKISILGHSMSGILGFIMASTFPDKVDLLICLDIVKPELFVPSRTLAYKKHIIDQFIEKNNRNRNFMEPPSYTQAVLTEILHEGSRKSVDREHAQSLLERSVSSSKKFPEKYYFSRDGQLKNIMLPFYIQAISNDMAKKVTCPHLIILYQQSYAKRMQHHLEVLDILKKKQHFELYSINGSHHNHLNDPLETSILINKFLKKYNRLEAMRKSKL